MPELYNVPLHLEPFCACLGSRQKPVADRTAKCMKHTVALCEPFFICVKRIQQFCVRVEEQQEAKPYH